MEHSVLISPLPALLSMAADHSRLTRTRDEARAAATAFPARPPVDSHSSEHGLATASGIPLSDPIDGPDVGNAGTVASAAKPDALRAVFLAAPGQVPTTLLPEGSPPWMRFVDGAFWEAPRLKRRAATGIPALFPLQAAGAVVGANARDAKLGVKVHRLPGG